MKIANQNLLRSVAEEPNTYAVRDKKYRIAAIPITISKFGPSGSLKSENSTLEHTMDVTPRISNKVFFDLKSIFAIIVSLTQGES